MRKNAIAFRTVSPLTPTSVNAAWSIEGVAFSSLKPSVKRNENRVIRISRSAFWRFSASAALTRVVRAGVEMPSLVIRPRNWSVLSNIVCSRPLLLRNTLRSIFAGMPEALKPSM